MIQSQKIEIVVYVENTRTGEKDQMSLWFWDRDWERMDSGDQESVCRDAMFDLIDYLNWPDTKWKWERRI
jgi:hypothetical protein